MKISFGNFRLGGEKYFSPPSSAGMLRRALTGEIPGLNTFCKSLTNRPKAYIEIRQSCLVFSETRRIFEDFPIIYDF